MNAKLMRVVQQGEAFAVQSQKSENGQLMKCNIVLQEMGGKLAYLHSSVDIVIPRYSIAYT